MTALSKSQSLLFGRVSKPFVEASTKNEPAPATPPPAPAADTTLGLKRKRDENSFPGSSSDPSIPRKKLKLSIPQLHRSSSQSKVNLITRSFPFSTRGNKAEKSSLQQSREFPVALQCLSEPLRDLVTIHRFVLKALSMHYAHSGPTTPAELGRLLETATRLWKKRSVAQEDVQKMLAMYEISSAWERREDKAIPQALGPFKLVKAGLCTKIEYSGKRRALDSLMSTLFDEKELDEAYQFHICTLYSAWHDQGRADLSFLDDHSLDRFPKLVIDVGTQTATRNAYSSQQRREILKLSRAAQLLKIDISVAASREGKESSGTIAIVESRKQSLLDRIKAKELASRASDKPTSADILRKHALGRIEEVAEVLRMMQREQRYKVQPNCNTREHYFDRHAPGTGFGRVSFGLGQITNAIRDSARVPISDEEVVMCLKLMSDGLDGSWVKVIDRRCNSRDVFVVLEGQGLNGKELGRRLTAQKA